LTETGFQTNQIVYSFLNNQIVIFLFLQPDEGFGTAPPIDILDRIKGYEMVSFDTTRSDFIGGNKMWPVQCGVCSGALKHKNPV
jgi:hypothetical protein